MKKIVAWFRLANSVRGIPRTFSPDEIFKEESSIIRFSPAGNEMTGYYPMFLRKTLCAVVLSVCSGCGRRRSRRRWLAPAWGRRSRRWAWRRSRGSRPLEAQDLREEVQIHRWPRHSSDPDPSPTTSRLPLPLVTGQGATSPSPLVVAWLTAVLKK